MNHDPCEQPLRDKARRVVILGATGFIGRAIRAQLHQNESHLALQGSGLPGLDLTRSEHAAQLVEWLTPDTILIHCAAIKRQIGDTLDAFERNIAITVNLCRLLEKRPVLRTIYFSSAAVYGEENTDMAITEETPVRPTSLYGAGKFACEGALRKTVQAHSVSSLVVLRPALIYGPGDQGGYGPSGFVRAAARGQGITLWGDGTERREFVFVADVARLVNRLLFHPFNGVLNVVTGHSHTFAEAVEIVSGLAPMAEQLSVKPRTKPKADHGFDTRRLQATFPDFLFTSLEDGIRLTFEAERTASATEVIATAS